MNNPTFGDFELALKTKEVISLLVRKEVEGLRPIPRYAIVSSLDPLEVVYGDDTTPVPVKSGSILPQAVGQVVRVEGPPGDRYISDVTGAMPGVDPYDPSVFGSITVDGVVIDSSALTAPTGFAVIEGLEFENIFTVSSWDAVVGAAQYQLEVAVKLGAATYDLTRILVVSSLDARVDGLQPYTEYGFRVRAINPIGVLGTVTAWLDFTTTGDSTIPPQVDLPVLSRGSTSLVVSFNGLTSLDAPDVANGNGLYEVQIDTVNTFDGVDLRSALTTSTILSFSDITTEDTWYCRVRAIDTSGNLGVWSNTATGDFGSILGTWLTDGTITGGKVADGAIGSDQLAVASVIAGKIAANAIYGSNIIAGEITSDKINVAGLDAAHIKFGTMSGARITADTLDVNSLISSTLTSKTITLGTGGQIKIGNPPTDGLYINDQGITAYKSSVQTMRVANDGTATFSDTVSGATITGGTISGTTITGGLLRTASSGNRIEITDFAASGTIYFYVDSTNYAKMVGSLVGSSGYLYVYSPDMGGGKSYIGFGSTPTANYVTLHADTVTLGAYGDDVVSSGIYYTTTGGSANVNVSATGGGILARSVSSAKYKREITEYKDETLLDKLLNVKPVKFKSKAVHDDPEKWYFGVIAEQVAEVFGDDAGLFVTFNEDGEPESVMYDRLWLPLLMSIQKKNQRKING